MAKERLAGIKILLCSFRFNPGHLSHLIAHYKLLDEEGYDVAFWWNNSFSTMVDEQFKDLTIRSREVLSLDRKIVMIVWFPSVYAIFTGLLLRYLKKAKMVYIYHEPFESLREYYGSGFKLRDVAKICIAAITSEILCQLSSMVVLPSKRAHDVYNLRDRLRAPNTHIDLIYDDERLILDVCNDSPRYISYIGTVAADHAFDEFVEFAKLELDTPRHPDYNIMIATKSRLSEKIIDRLKKADRFGRLKIISGRPLSNSEINLCFQLSMCVWNVYTRSMQSGIRIKALMFGVPLLYSTITQPVEAKEKETGVLVKDGQIYEEISIAIDTIKANRNRYALTARKVFEQKYLYSANKDNYLNILEEVI